MKTLILLKRESSPEIVYRLRNVILELLPQVDAAHVEELNCVLQPFSYYFQLYLPTVVKCLESNSEELICSQVVHCVSDAILAQKGFFIVANQSNVFQGLSYPTFLYPKDSTRVFNVVQLGNLSKDMWDWYVDSTCLAIIKFW